MKCVVFIGGQNYICASSANPHTPLAQLWSIFPHIRHFTCSHKVFKVFWWNSFIVNMIPFHFDGLLPAITGHCIVSAFIRCLYKFMRKPLHKYQPLHFPDELNHEHLPFFCQWLKWLQIVINYLFDGNFDEKCHISWSIPFNCFQKM